MAWRLYIDDSGTREYADDQVYGVDKGRSRHFVYGAVLGTDRQTAVLAERWRELKRLAFGTPDLEIKSNWLRIERERRVRYLEPYGLVDANLNTFVDNCYKLIAVSEVLLVAAVVDKVDMQSTYANPYYAPTVAYEILLQRVVQTVRSPETVAVTVDDISGATPKRSQYKMLLQNHHRQLRRDGSSLLRGVPSAASLSFAVLDETVRFVNSAHSELVQIADLVSYCVHRQFRDHGEDWEAEEAKHLPLYPYLRRIVGRFLCDPARRIQGYGIVKFPLKTRVQWRISKRKDDAAP